MPVSPSGNYTLPNGYLGIYGEDILPSQHNPPLQDIQSALNLALWRDGRAPMTDDLNMNTFKLLNVANGTTGTDGVNKAQLDGAITFPNASSFVFDVGNKMVLFGSTGVITDAGGTALVNFPIAFTSAPTVVIAMNGNASFYTGSISLFPGYTINGFGISTNPVLNVGSILVNYVAIGAKT